MATRTEPQTQITTADPAIVAASPTPTPPPATAPQPPPGETGSEAAAQGAATAERLEQQVRPPAGARPGFLAEATPHEGSAGIEGEQVIWEARYSLKNF